MARIRHVGRIFSGAAHGAVHRPDRDGKVGHDSSTKRFQGERAMTRSCPRQGCCFEIAFRLSKAILPNIIDAFDEVLSTLLWVSRFPGPAVMSL